MLLGDVSVSTSQHRMARRESRRAASMREAPAAAVPAVKLTLDEAAVDELQDDQRSGMKDARIAKDEPLRPLARQATRRVSQADDGEGSAKKVRMDAAAAEDEPSGGRKRRHEKAEATEVETPRRTSPEVRWTARSISVLVVFTTRATHCCHKHMFCIYVSSSSCFG